jgi:hypothetical protein
MQFISPIQLIHWNRAGMCSLIKFCRVSSSIRVSLDVKKSTLKIRTAHKTVPDTRHARHGEKKKKEP